jgi:spermidine/putrescine transport system permease protein
MTAAAPPTVRRGLFGEGVRRHLITFYALLALAYLMLPVVIVILFSFNDKNGKFNFVWNGFTLHYWKTAFGIPGLFDAFLTSLRIALISSFVATILGTLIALALIRYRYRGRAATNIFIFLPMATPEVVMGSSLLALFLTFKIQTGFITIVIAHILFIISFVVVTVTHASPDSTVTSSGDGSPTVDDLPVTLPMIVPGCAPSSSIRALVRRFHHHELQFRPGRPAFHSQGAAVSGPATGERVRHRFIHHHGADEPLRVDAAAALWSGAVLLRRPGVRRPRSPRRFRPQARRCHGAGGT